MSGSEPALAIEVAAPCAEWRRACPEAEALVAAAARLALADSLEEGVLPSGARVVVGITLADDAEQRRLNRTYRGTDAATNVLAFPVADPATFLPAGAPLLLGDVVLALETIAREAAEQEKPLADHVRHLVVHGVLHLLGHDHAADAEAAAMEVREVAILARLGVPNPYRDTMSTVEPEPLNR